MSSFDSGPHDTSPVLSDEDRQRLLEVAAESIRHGLRIGRPLDVDLAGCSEPLRQHRSSFVTLRIAGALRGCIGSVEGSRPLVRDVAINAFGAAFQDPRFLPLSPEEFPRLDYHISVLSGFEPLRFRGEAELLDKIRPGIDGLVIEYGPYRGLLLPSVWTDLPEKADFLRHLKLKAGLPPDFWSDQVRVERFTSESFGRDDCSATDPPSDEPTDHGTSPPPQGGHHAA